jgi:hypothetical protein
MRDKCSSCPFNPESKAFRFRDHWAAELDDSMFEEGLPMDGSVAHGCHELHDVGTCYDPNLMCIGHLQHMEANRRLPTVESVVE